MVESRSASGIVAATVTLSSLTLSAAKAGADCESAETARRQKSSDRFCMRMTSKQLHVSSQPRTGAAAAHSCRVVGLPSMASKISFDRLSVSANDLGPAKGRPPICQPSACNSSMRTQTTSRNASDPSNFTMAFPAIQLFVERAAAVLDGFELTDANAPIIADICRRLDGIALAIELAAGRIDAFGLRELAARLDDRFRLLTRGRRTALPRHQTLSTTLDWSYQLLPESERTVLHRVAVFAGRFTLEAVEAVISGGESVVDQVANLVAKSLITADIGGDVVYYRLLETTRAYALDKLEESGERSEYVRRHADYFRALFRRAELEWDRRPTAEWVAAYVSQTDNARAALEWAFSASGDGELGIDLTIVTVPLWLQLSLMDECRKHVDRALAAARARTEHDPRRDMQLNAALGSSLVYTSMAPEARSAWGRALEIAKGVGDTDYQLRSLWGLWVDGLNTGGFKNALSLANQFYGVAAHSSDPLDALMGDRMIGIAQHFIGEQREARQHID